MLNLTLKHLIVRQSLSQSPFLNKKSFSFHLLNSDFSKFCAPLTFRSVLTEIKDTRLSRATNGAVLIDGNLQHLATGNQTIQQYQQFYALNCFFLKCKSSSNGAAFLSPGKDGIVSFERCYFEKCETSKEGGAIYILEGSLHLIDCTFIQCRADASVQAVYAHGEPRRCLRTFRVYVYQCPLSPPFSQGCPLGFMKGDQSMRDTNISVAILGSGSGGFKAFQPTEYNGKFVYISKTQGTHTILMTHHQFCVDPLVMEYFTFVNNTCEKDELISCDVEVFLKNSILFDNSLTPVKLKTPKPTKKPKIASFKIGDDKAPPTPKPKKKKNPSTKTILVKYEKIRFDKNHPELRSQNICQDCDLIESAVTPFPVVMPRTPGIKKKTPHPPPPPYNIKLCVMMPFLCLIVLLIGLVMKTTNCRDSTDYVEGIEDIPHEHEDF